ncbi:MAG: monovalent cation/H(+) antiporter subunit G [Syntrophobacteria bacterium]|jgi:multicomponent Na+:H+ antiporter subunit G
MSLTQWLSLGLTLLGMPFFLSGTVGLLRFPDIYTRLHALTKADNVGLGLVTMGAMLQAESWVIALKLLLIWLLILVTSATSCHLVARAALRRGIRPWQNR